jgi:predicted nucleotidyltransferase component of viral defense system
VNGCETSFFLTGGTALSRCYYGHRYSDDLGFFASSDDAYAAHVKTAMEAIEKGGFVIDRGERFTQNVTFCSYYVRREGDDTELKLDFVNDLVPHFGNFVKTELFSRTDCIENMLSNKISAIFRFAAKDVADIREIFLREKEINWLKIFRQATEKEAGIDISYICEIITGMPEKEYANINWVRDPGWEVFRADLFRIAETMLSAEA